jgi:hypothetical protein
MRLVVGASWSVGMLNDLAWDKLPREGCCGDMSRVWAGFGMPGTA